MREGGKQSLTPLYRGGQKGFTLGKTGGGQEKFDGLYPLLLWVLNFCKNCMTFGNANIFTNLTYLQHSKSNLSIIYNNATWSTLIFFSILKNKI